MADAHLIAHQEMFKLKYAPYFQAQEKKRHQLAVKQSQIPQPNGVTAHQNANQGCLLAEQCLNHVSARGYSIDRQIALNLINSALLTGILPYQQQRLCMYWKAQLTNSPTKPPTFSPASPSLRNRVQ